MGLLTRARWHAEHRVGVDGRNRGDFGSRVVRRPRSTLAVGCFVQCRFTDASVYLWRCRMSTSPPVAHLRPRPPGWRTILVDRRSYYWRFAGTIRVCAAWASQRTTLIVDLGWSDPWLALPDGAASSSTGGAITPALISQAIRWAFQVGWMPDQRHAPLRIQRMDDGFALAT